MRLARFMLRRCEGDFLSQGQKKKYRDPTTFPNMTTRYPWQLVLGAYTILALCLGPYLISVGCSKDIAGSCFGGRQLVIGRALSAEAEGGGSNRGSINILYYIQSLNTTCRAGYDTSVYKDVDLDTFVVGAKHELLLMDGHCYTLWQAKQSTVIGIVICISAIPGVVIFFLWLWCVVIPKWREDHSPQNDAPLTVLEYYQPTSHVTVHV